MLQAPQDVLRLVTAHAKVSPPAQRRLSEGEEQRTRKTFDVGIPNQAVQGRIFKRLQTVDLKFAPRQFRV